MRISTSIIFWTFELVSWARAVNYVLHTHVRMRAFYFSWLTCAIFKLLYTHTIPTFMLTGRAFTFAYIFSTLSMVQSWTSNWHPRFTWAFFPSVSTTLIMTSYSSIWTFAVLFSSNTVSIMAFMWIMWWARTFIVIISTSVIPTFMLSMRTWAMSPFFHA